MSNAPDLDSLRRQARAKYAETAMQVMREGLDLPLPAPYNPDKWMPLIDCMKACSGEQAQAKFLEAVKSSLNMKDADASGALMEFARMFANDYATACLQSSRDFAASIAKACADITKGSV